MDRQAKLSELKPGDRLRCDDGFTCVDHGAVVVVKMGDEKNEDSALYFDCARGKHWLDGQLEDDADTLAGLVLVDEEDA